MQRVNHDFPEIDRTIEDVISEFSFMPIKDVRQALRNGSLGRYGLSYRLSTQEVCVWILKYLDSQKSKLNL